MKIIGIVGGVASGKSVVSSRLQSLGAYVIDADQIGHRVLELAEVIEAGRQRWGDSVVDAEGRLVRSVVAERVFGNTPQHELELKFWESQTHPRITERLQQKLEELRQSARYPAAVLDAPVMFKAGWNTFCDVMLFVDAPVDVRRARASARGWSAEQFHDRERSQTSLPEKRRESDFVIDNSGDLEQTYEQVLSFWKSLSL